MKNLNKIVYSYNTKYDQGFTEDEIFSLIKQIGGDINIARFNDAMMGNTCMVIDNQIINYHCDVLTALRCGYENRGLKFSEFD
jgi:hypothetical protein